MAHTCHATGCKIEVPPVMMLCRNHWYALPWQLRRRIRNTYREGQCDDWKPSKEYLLAAKDAVEWLARREGRTPDTSIYDTFLKHPEMMEKIKGAIDADK